MSDTILQNQYLCKNAKIDTFGSLHDNVSYNWFIKKAGQSDWTLDSNTTSAFYFKLNIDTTFYIKRIAINSIGCDYISNSIKVTYEQPVNTISPKYPASPYCYYGANGSDPSINTAEIKYKWYVSYDIGGALPHYLPYINAGKDTLINLQIPNNSSREFSSFKSYRLIQYNHCYDTSVITTTYTPKIISNPNDVNKCYSLNDHVLINGEVNSNSNFRIIWQLKPKLATLWQTVVDTNYISNSFDTI